MVRGWAERAGVRLLAPDCNAICKRYLGPNGASAVRVSWYRYRRLCGAIVPNPSPSRCTHGLFPISSIYLSHLSRPVPPTLCRTWISINTTTPPIVFRSREHPIHRAICT